MGKNITRAFPAISLVEYDIHTARHTNKLHRIPDAKASVNDRDVFNAATLIVYAPSRPSV